VKINQYCSVCKMHLDMEVIPTDDGGDDGVIWLRCPQCQGFLPKFAGDTRPPVPQTAAQPPSPPSDPTVDLAAEGPESVPALAADEDEDEEEGDSAAAPAATAPAEPLAEYAARLAAADVTRARPYRPTSEYAVGDVIHHLANDDLGIVVAKAELPGGRRAVKVFFEGTGVVHLIEQAPDRR